MTWTHSNKLFEETPEEYQGFVYLITELDTGKMYVGKKFFWKPKTLPVTKTRKRKIKTRAESDWKDYYGSNKEVQLRVEENGRDNYTREILHLCKTKGECSYLELHEQMNRKVLLKDEYYNEFVGAKIHAKHVSGLKDGSL
jgi:hypothetical protein